MDGVIPLLVIVVLVGGWNLFLSKQSGGRVWSRMWMAFTATSAAILYVVAGAIGYTLSRHERFVAHTSWAGHVIWSEIGIGVVAGLLAIYFWRRALRGGRPA